MYKLKVIFEQTMMVSFMVLCYVSVYGLFALRGEANGMGLRSGLPTLVIALALDQYFYGRMDHRVGCGPKPLYIRKKLCSIEEIADSLKDLVSGKYDAKAQEVSQRIRKENGVVTAADAIEKYVLEKTNE